MSPLPALRNLPDQSLAHVKLSRYAPLRDSSRKAVAYFSDSGRIQSALFGVRTFAVTVTFSLPILGHHVGHVLLVRTQEEMVRIAAGRIVATMQDARTAWHSTAHQHPGNAVRQVPASPDPKTSIAMLRAAGKPGPARIDAIVSFHPTPEEVSQWRT